MAQDDNKRFDRDMWLGDTGASCYMGNSDEGMFDCEEINQPVTIGDGKAVTAVRVGKLRRTIVQKDGSSLDVVLYPYKHVPKLHVNLFSITKALQSGWQISNKKMEITLQRKSNKIVFDHTFKTDHGILCGVRMVPRYEGRNANHAYTAFDINKMHRIFNHASIDVL